jgi:hypothetical protein
LLVSILAPTLNAGSDDPPFSSKRGPLFVESFALNVSELSHRDSKIRGCRFMGIINRIAAVLQVHQRAENFFPFAFVELVVH